MSLTDKLDLMANDIAGLSNDDLERLAALLCKDYATRASRLESEIRVTRNILQRINTGAIAFGEVVAVHLEP